jgi:hypothetical protein
VVGNDEQVEWTVSDECIEGDAGESLMMGDFTYLAFETLSVIKVRKFGFHGYVDTEENTFESFEKMSRLGTLPPTKVDAARPLV